MQIYDECRLAVGRTPSPFQGPLAVASQEGYSLRPRLGSWYRHRIRSNVFRHLRPRNSQGVHLALTSTSSPTGP